MKKTGALWLVAGLIFLAVFNTIFYIVGGVEHDRTVWLSYGLIHFSFLMLALTPVFQRKAREPAVLGLALISVSTCYFAAELIAGSCFILFLPQEFDAALSVQLALAGFYGVLLLLNMITNEHTAADGARRQAEAVYAQAAASEMSALLEGVADRGLKRKVEALYDSIRTSPRKSHPSVAPLERSILDAVAQLKTSLGSGGAPDADCQIERLKELVERRNRELRSLN